jgi:hypothetical protein
VWRGFRRYVRALTVAIELFDRVRVHREAIKIARERDRAFDTDNGLLDLPEFLITEWIVLFGAASLVRDEKVCQRRDRVGRPLAEHRL